MEVIQLFVAERTWSSFFFLFWVFHPSNTRHNFHLLHPSFPLIYCSIYLSSGFIRLVSITFIMIVSAHIIQKHLFDIKHRWQMVLGHVWHAKTNTTLTKKTKPAKTNAGHLKNTSKTQEYSFDCPLQAGTVKEVLYQLHITWDALQFCSTYRSTNIPHSLVLAVKRIGKPNAIKVSVNLYIFDRPVRFNFLFEMKPPLAWPRFSLERQ